MSKLRLRLPSVGRELLVAARQGNGASVGTYRLGHSAVGAPVVRDQHGREAVIGAVGRAVEVRGRTVWAHGAAGGQTAGVSGDDLGCCWVSGLLGQTPGAAHVRLQVKRLRVFQRRIPGQVRRARGSVGSPHPPPPPVVPPLKHVLKGGVQHPVVALPIPPVLPTHLEKTLIERQVVPYAILPPFFILLVVRELGDDVVVYPAEGLPLVVAVPNSHGDESHVRIRRLLQLAGVLRNSGLRRGRVGADVQELRSLFGGVLLLCGHGSGVRCVRPAGGKKAEIIAAL